MEQLSVDDSMIDGNVIPNSKLSDTTARTSTVTPAAVARRARSSKYFAALFVYIASGSHPVQRLGRDGARALWNVMFLCDLDSRVTHTLRLACNGA